jgi:hypothetical protein
MQPNLLNHEKESGRERERDRERQRERQKERKVERATVACDESSPGTGKPLTLSLSLLELGSIWLLPEEYRRLLEMDG